MELFVKSFDVAPLNLNKAHFPAAQKATLNSFSENESSKKNELTSASKCAHNATANILRFSRHKIY